MTITEKLESVLNQHIQTPAKDKLSFQDLGSHAIVVIATLQKVTVELTFLLPED